jgi:hypothetical protein
MFDFRFNTPISLNQGQRSVFMLRQCAQSISHIEKHMDSRFSAKIRIFDHLRFNTPTPFLEPGTDCFKNSSVFMPRQCVQSISEIETLEGAKIFANFNETLNSILFIINNTKIFAKNFIQIVLISKLIFVKTNSDMFLELYSNFVFTPNRKIL